MSSTENTDPGRIATRSERVYGIRMTLPEDDSFIGILGRDWEMYRWYASAAERDEALETMRAEHLYSRSGDRPMLRYSRVERDKPGEYLRKPAA